MNRLAASEGLIDGSRFYCGPFMFHEQQKCHKHAFKIESTQRLQEVLSE